MNTIENTIVDNNSDTIKGLSIDKLKYIAIIAMLIDHVGNAFVYESAPNLYFVMTLIGRITGPVMFFSAVEGYHHTKNFEKYVLRLLIFALVSYFPYMYAFNDDFNILRLNVIFTILFGVVAIHARRNIKNIFLKISVILLLMIISLPADYGHTCIITMIVLDYYYGNRKNQIAGYILVAAIEFDVLSLIIHPFWKLIYDNNFDINYIKDNYYLLGYLIPIFLFYIYNGKRGKASKFSKWIFYIFYPLHLAVIAIIRLFLI